MTQDHAQLAQWDAAYVLGALTSRDRQRYEEHVQACDQCRGAVAELAPLAGLLSRATGTRAAVPDDTAVTAETPPPARPAEHDTRPRIGSAHRVPRRKRSFVHVSTLSLLAAVAAVLICIPLATVLRNAAATVAMVQVVDSPLSATLRLADSSDGTRIWMECDYDVEPGASGRSSPLDYALIVTERNGDEHQLSTWSGLPGESFQLETVTALSAEEIDTIDIRIVGAESPLLMSAFDR